MSVYILSEPVVDNTLNGQSLEKCVGGKCTLGQNTNSDNTATQSGVLDGKPPVLTPLPSQT